jgi:hypothetical protein
MDLLVLKYRRRPRARRCYRGLAAVAALAAIQHPAAVAADAVAQAPTTLQTQDSIASRFVGIVDKLSDYSLVMTKQQRIGDDLKPEETILVKHRHAPECRYLRWLSQDSRGREAIYCENRYDGKMKVHQPGFFTLSLSPGGRMAMRSNLRPLSQSGLYNMAVIVNEASQAVAEGRLAVGTSTRELDGEAATCINRQGSSPIDQQLPYVVGAAELCFDTQTALPVLAQFWDDQHRLMEHYRFSDIRLNPGLSDRDFDTDNPDYGF